MSRRRHILAAAIAAVALAGCGGSGGGSAEAPKSSRLVDLEAKPPLVNALDIDPADGRFLLTTNRGFFRIDPKTDKVEQVRGTITANGESSTVGTFLELTSIGPKTLLGSGHPDEEGTLPAYLGFLRSDDAGRSWQVLSRLGEADLHKIIEQHGRIYAFDAVLGAMLISDDGGRTFIERFTPRGLVIDFVVDPKDPSYILASTEDQLFRSEDEGEKWRGILSAQGMRLTWPAPDMLLRADQDGRVYRSSDRGQTFQPVGKVPGEPYKFKTLDAQRHFLALSDGTIVATQDGGKTWRTEFKP